jgi:hypothetical protein
MLFFYFYSNFKAISMKKNISVSVFLLLAASFVTAQVPKYVLFEHFTNTRCGVCGGSNPTFYQNININNNPKLHHVTIHPSIPYSACVFYQANMTEQNARATFYNLPGTPRVSVNGATTMSVSNTNAATIDNAYCATCSPIEVRVTEQNNGSNRSASVQIKSVGAPPSGNYRLFAAIVEKNVYYNAPNTETVHHNVFRQFLTTSTGDAVSLAAQGSQTNVNFNYTINSNWVANEIYVLAWLYDATTNTVVNSGTKFDAQTIIPVELSAWTGRIEGDKNRLSWETRTERNVDFFDIERADDGKNFTSVGRIKAAGSSAAVLKYAFDDAQPLSNTAYYRLKTVDLDGTFSVSATLTLARTGKTSNDLTLFPTLARQTLQINYFSDKTASEWRVLDGFGKVVRQFSKGQNGQNTEGVQSETLDVSTLPSGVYFVQLVTKTGTSTGRFFKVN